MSPSTSPFEVLRAMSPIEWLRTLRFSKGLSNGKSCLDGGSGMLTQGLTYPFSFPYIKRKPFNANGHSSSFTRFCPVHKSDLKDMACQAEKKLTESILRWKYRKEGRPVPKNDVLERQSEQVRDEAHRILSKRSKRVWEELKKAYRRGEGSKE
jgi:hypothetical protein